MPAPLLRALAAAAVCAAAPRAYAQACCTGGAAYAPTRLALHEDWLVGAIARATDQRGTFDATGSYAGTPGGYSELGFEEDLAATARVLDRGQVGLLLPFVETRRLAPPIAESGGGLGDVSLSLRWDILRAGESVTVPGVALVGAVTAPSGRSPEAARFPLGSDATGTGAWQGALGAAVEQVFGRVSVNATATLGASTARTVGGVSGQLGPQGQLFLSGAYSFPSVFTLAYLRSGDSSVAGATKPGTGRSLATASAIAAIPLSDTWRASVLLFHDLPILGENHPVALGGTLSLFRVWL
jgi:hypothetical protein